MSVTSGFFNSLNGDRRYSAEQFSALIDTLIIDGVFSNVGTAFGVVAQGGTSIGVGIGRAWFNSTWIYNDTVLPMTVRDAELVLDRIDAVVIEVNRNETVRAGSIRFVNGVPSGDPQRPELTNSEEVHQYPLAYIYRKAGVNNVTQADITNMIGTSACPYVIGILDTQNIDKLIAQWNSEFNTWFEGLEDVLSGDVAGNIALRLIELEEKFRTLAREKAVYEALEDSDEDEILDSNGAAVEGRTVMAGDSSGSYSNYYEDFEKLQKMISSLTTDDVFQVGDILQTARTDLSDNWLLCNGSVLPKSGFQELSPMIPENFSAGWNAIKIYDRSQSYNREYNISDMIYANGYYVAIVSPNQYNGVVCYSKNLEGPWTSTVLWGDATTSSDGLCGIVYANGYYVVAGHVTKSNKVYLRISYTSDLTTTWAHKDTELGSNSGYSHEICGITYGNGYFYVLYRYANGTYSDYKTYIRYFQNPWDTPLSKTLISGTNVFGGPCIRFLNDRLVVIIVEISSSNTYRTAVMSAQDITSSFSKSYLNVGSSDILAPYHVEYLDGKYVVSCIDHNNYIPVIYYGTELSSLGRKELPLRINDGYGFGISNAIFNGKDFLISTSVRSGTYDETKKAPCMWDGSSLDSIDGNFSYAYPWGANINKIFRLLFVNNKYVLYANDTNTVSYVMWKDYDNFILPTISVDSAYAYIKAKE